MTAMDDLDDLDRALVAAAKKRARLVDSLAQADAELHDLFRKGRAAGKGPSHMGRLTGFTREWVAKIAPKKS